MAEEVVEGLLSSVYFRTGRGKKLAVCHGVPRLAVWMVERRDGRHLNAALCFPLIGVQTGVCEQLLYREW